MFVINSVQLLVSVQQLFL